MYIVYMQDMIVIKQTLVLINMQLKYFQKLQVHCWVYILSQFPVLVH